jgi:lipopolysaccharide/colanic/teichoic acid biosynthesis glycosyltransferase
MGNNYPRITAMADPASLRSKARKMPFSLTSSTVRRVATFQEEAFHDMLLLERRRAERSRKPFVLMLLDAAAFLESGTAESVLASVTSVILKSTRETDLVGWYQDGIILGVIFTEVSLECGSPITEILRSKVVSALQTELSTERTSRFAITVHLFPESQGRSGADPVADFRLYPELAPSRSKNRISQAVKRLIDITASGALLILLSPLFAAIALLIKMTSKGPTIFQQERLGQFGRPFMFLKFRTMFTNNDPKIHKDYVQRYISGQPHRINGGKDETVVYKITEDPRVTPIGRVLRKTSLDELPQFWNVLVGKMSLVGPRPPLPYEFEIYDIWHRRRVLEVRPGVTGLWQVSGRSRTRFDEMVRLDLRYIQSWSLWLDLKILAATPRAVLSGEGAF